MAHKIIKELEIRVTFYIARQTNGSKNGISVQKHIEPLKGIIMKKLSLSKIILGTCVVLASQVQAAVVDFTASSPWAGANGQTSFTSGIVTLNASGTILGSPAYAILTFNAPSCGNAGVGLACQGDGIGINRTSRFALLDQNDEIDSTEILKVSFGSLVSLSGLKFLNLVYTNNILTETMDIRVNGGSWSTLTPTGSVAGGFFAPSFSATGVSNFELRGGLLSNGSLAALDYEIPTPASIALLGIGALGLLFAKRKKLV